MRWEDERYVRLYTRDTPEWTLLSWESRALFRLLLSAVDRAGLINLGRSGLKGVASLLRMPLAAVERAMPELLEDGCVAIHGDVLIIPNFIEAQEANQSDVARKRAERERARDKANATELGLIHPREAVVSHDVTAGHAAGQDVTGGHGRSRAVTLIRSDLCLDDPDMGSAVAARPPHVPQAIPDAAQGTGDETAPPLRQDGAGPTREAQAVATPAAAAVNAKAAPSRGKQRHETECPNSEATGDEVKAWLSTWKITGDEAEIAHWMDHHRSKGNRFRDWLAAWRTWQRNGARFGRSSLPMALQPAAKQPVEVAQVGLWMENLRNAKAGEHVR